jgi:hypothetical protein
MCTWIVETTDIAGSGKGAQGWFSLQQAHVAYDHPFHASIDHAVLIDFVNDNQGASARVAVELTVESARGLVRAIEAALEAAEKEYAIITAPHVEAVASAVSAS